MSNKQLTTLRDMDVDPHSTWRDQLPKVVYDSRFTGMGESDGLGD